MQHSLIRSLTTRHVLGGFFALALALLAVFAGLGATPASATPVPTPTPTPTGDLSTTFSIGGIIRDGDDPIPDVDVFVEGEGFDETGTTGDDGRWSVQVPSAGQYTVTLDVESLPEGIVPRDPENIERQVNLGTTNTVNILFPTGEGATTSTSFIDTLATRAMYGLNFGLLLAIAAIGISLIYGTTKLNNFAHGEMVTFGAVMFYLFGTIMNLNIALAAAIAVVLSAGFGWAQDAWLYKPLRRRGVGLVQVMIVAIGLSLVVRYVILYFMGGNIETLDTGLTQTITLGPVTMTAASYVSMGISIVLLVLVGLFLTRTRIGKATRAVSDNAALAATSGINVNRIIRIVWVMAGALAGFSGILYGLFRQVSWDMGFQILLLLFAAVTLGGLGSAFGALAGSIVIGLVTEISTVWLPNDLRYAVALIILILVLLVRPQGILGRAERVG